MELEDERPAAAPLTMQGITPELALVDSGLAAAARAFLPNPGDCLAPRPRPAAAAVALQRAEEPSQQQRRSPLTLLATAAASLIICGALASPLLAFLPPRQQPTIIDQHTVPRSTPAAPR